MDKTEKTIIGVVIASVVGCLIISSLCVGVILLAGKIIPSNPVSTPLTELPSPTPLTQKTAIILQGDDDLNTALDTLEALESISIPTADLLELAERFKGVMAVPTHLTSPPRDYEVGDQLDFWKLDIDTNENIRITATLRYATDEVYFWAENDVFTDKRELKIMVEKFAKEIYPRNQEFFGSEWMPGVDNDPHLYILYARGLGSHIAGYTSTTDSVLPQVHEYSNSHEMFALNADVQTITDPYTLSVLAHEFQHLIHGYHDPNEELWMNEGFSELATLLNGYDAGGFDTVFSYEPDLQLNDWSTDGDENDAHYGASFLFTTYLLERFGEDFTKAVVANPLNGLASIDDVFSTNKMFDPLSGDLLTADELFRDWTITNLLHDPEISDGRYTYTIYQDAPTASIRDMLSNCDGSIQSGSVHQYGTDYIEINCPNQDLELRFSGDAIVPVLPLAVDDNTFVWSNRADSSDTSYQKQFDLTNANGFIEFQFDTWYDLEIDYDYVYLSASENGTDWEILTTPSCTTYDPSGNSYGCGYNGASGGWITEKVDISDYTGSKVWLRFEYVTDGAVTGEGFVVDNISIPGIGYHNDFEDGNGGWENDGFVRIQNAIPQTFLITLVDDLGGAPISRITVEPGDEVSMPLGSLDQDGHYILIVSGTARYTRQPANYQFSAVKK